METNISDNSGVIGKVTIYLVRHAQTSGNVGMKIMDANEDILTDLGKIQGNLLGMHLSSVTFDHAFSSDYGRALKTAEGVLKHSNTSSKIPIEPCDRLREVNFGRYETTSYKETFAYCKSLNQSIFDWKFPEGESFAQAGQRMLLFIEELCMKLMFKHGKEESPTVLIVGHSAAIAFFLHAVCETSKQQVIGLEKTEMKLMRNTCYLKFEVEKSGIGATRTSKEKASASSSQLTFKFLEKYYSKHLDCIKGITKDVNPLLQFANGSSSGKEYVGCIQQ